MRLLEIKFDSHMSTLFRLASDEVVVELRKSRRYRLMADASFSWVRPDGLLQEAKGTIRDISDRGVFVSGEVVPPTGARLDVDVYLPSLEIGSSSVHLHGEGIVVRVDKQAEKTRGFAAAVSFQTEGGGAGTVHRRDIQ